MKRLKILITGANGFIGRNLQEYFSSKYQLLTPNSQCLNLSKTTKVYQYLSENRPDVIIHTAFCGVIKNAKSKKNLIYHNLMMLINLMKSQRFYKKIIVLGSGAEYDKSRDLKQVGESEFGKNVPQDEYGFSKYIGSLLIKNQKKFVNLRLFGVYGKYENYKIRFIPNVICKMLFNLPIIINQNAYFDYLYVDDLVRIIDYFINNKPKHKFYNIGSGQAVDLISLAKLILKISAEKLPIKVLNRGLNKEYTCDISRLKKEIPKFKHTTIEDSIKKLIIYYQSVLSSIKKEELDEANKRSN